ncbi:hypothetical protein [Hyalangium rubrum]|uniref:Uncharacterized protein n=1 Tax=Hyalangium rubrum TaxID=3103134 RepID=A0ABU5H4P0_9BACT|nr:hypothetical protein [Hyalangium sp. s54d21]MDY7227849.1 hypothetical protein [Hyalangium sp. s54d21]
MSLTLGLMALLAVSPAQVIEVEVFVPLCDGAQLACGRGGAGDPRSLEANLYWGAAYGAERFLKRAPGFQVRSRRDGPPDAVVLRELVLERTAGRGERTVRLSLRAYAGDRIDDALEDFLRAAAGGSSADLVVWAGHDRLMDRAPPETRAPVGAKPRPVAILACESEQYFGPVLRSLGVEPVLLTRTFMAPEAYLLEALAATVARHGPTDSESLRAALVAAYARYQRITPRAAGTVFSRLARSQGVTPPRLEPAPAVQPRQ